MKVIAADISKLEEDQTEIVTPKETLKSDDGSQVKVVENSSKTETTKAEEVESDYEDNITIMMPPVQVKNLNSGAIELSGRSVSHPKPPGIENSPHHKLQVTLSLISIHTLCTNLFISCNTNILGDPVTLSSKEVNTRMRYKIIDLIHIPIKFI